ncbi:MAG: polyprenyl synthetase family protein [Rhabdochlamydiaceae bacterium]|nr:polyprenyl synthetase family protein [Candidatus Amphrikana amoebophyrae]
MNQSPLSRLRNFFIEELKKDIPSLCPENKLVESAQYCLLNGGKRIRPIIALAISEKLGDISQAIPSALSVEYFHTSSLIADDLPCMDNEAFRRDKSTLHNVYGESTALLTSYGLISAAFAKIHENSTLSALSNERLALALECATRCAGFNGATTGQYWDLFPEQQNLEFSLKVIYHKTITLFEVAFLLGWIFGGGPLALLPKVKQLSFHYGMAFQITDDLLDATEDKINEKTVNISASVGLDKTEELLNTHVNSYLSLLDELDLKCDELIYIAEKLLSSALLA